MAEELLDVLTPDGEPTGLQKPRSEIHRDGSWHNSVHVWLVDGDSILLQKRADTKESYPGLYDASAAGHVRAGETLAEAAVRETFEELRITISEESLILAGTDKLCMNEENGSFVSNEYIYIYVVPIDKDSCDPKLQVEEVSEVRWEKIRTLYIDLLESKPGYCIDPEEVEMIGSCLMNLK